MKACELCKSPARIYCDSDQASLCWSCDAKVHSANFLVARHSRTLLCRVCQSPTRWTASGEKLGPSAVSVCEKCVVDATSDDEDDREESLEGNDDDDEYDGEEDGENEFDAEDGDDNQVVPLCFTPPPAASSSSSDDFSTDNRSVVVKRKRENVTDLSSKDDADCSSVHKNRREKSTAETCEVKVIGERKLYEFLPSSSEAMGEKASHREKISGEEKCGRRSVEIDLNSSDS